MGKPWENHGKTMKTMGKPWENWGFGKTVGIWLENFLSTNVIFQVLDDFRCCFRYHDWRIADQSRQQFWCFQSSVYEVLINKWTSPKQICGSQPQKNLLMDTYVILWLHTH
jgi:hypothetical protein